MQNIALFADDVLIYVSNPDTSLPALMSEFKVFEQKSGYKINVQKTQVLTFNYNPADNIKNLYEIDWDQKAIKYLGVKLTKDLTQLKMANYDPLMSKIKEEIERNINMTFHIHPKYVAFWVKNL
uniref:Reverse transcriptase domain-containing protein n=1 Tax=Periophthalmus magnuspinnatus TaxID=409849 RepID=A0A3B4A8K5_9GOBI